MNKLPEFDAKGSPADVPGFLVGQAEDVEGPTGVSVILCPQGAVGGVSLGGYATGTRGMDALKPWHMVGAVHGLVFTGGSSFGLSAVDGVLARLMEEGVGAQVGPARLPLVAGAVIFDLPITGGRTLPGPEMGARAAAGAGNGPLARGSVGAGAGATVGKLYGLARAVKGGVGGASLRLGDLRMGALAVVNSFGDVLDEQGRVLAGCRVSEDSREFLGTAEWFMAGGVRPAGGPPENTTLAVVATNARLDKAQASKVASMAQQGLVRSIQPVHTGVDGDLVCVLSAGGVEADITGLGLLAARLVEMAIRDGVRSARTLGGVPAISGDPGPRP